MIHHPNPMAYLPEFTQPQPPEPVEIEVDYAARTFHRDGELVELDRGLSPQRFRAIAELTAHLATQDRTGDAAPLCDLVGGEAVLTELGYSTHSRQHEPLRLMRRVVGDVVRPVEGPRIRGLKAYELLASVSVASALRQT